MIEVKAQLDPRSLHYLNGVMDEMVRRTGQERSTVIRNTAKDVLFFAMKKTHIASPRTPAWMNINKGTGKKVAWRKVKDVKKKYRGGRSINVSRGLSKAPWSIMRQALQAKASKAKGRRYGENQQEMKTKDTKDHEGITLSNTLPYIQDLDTGNYRKGKRLNILQSAVILAGARMEKSLNRMTETVIKGL